jgi:hypothetical protein
MPRYAGSFSSEAAAGLSSQVFRCISVGRDTREMEEGQAKTMAAVRLHRPRDVGAPTPALTGAPGEIPASGTTSFACGV